MGRFPERFLWGAATAAYQIERAYDKDGKGMSSWDTFSHKVGSIERGEMGDVAGDHSHMYAEDVQVIIKDSGHYSAALAQWGGLAA
jgi:beta-glucosidase/6-phospho-beta-glucosidase/beta-galactosidase